MTIRERFWHRVVLLAALVALIGGIIGIGSLSAQSFPAMAQASMSGLGGSFGGGEQDGQVESADEAFYWPGRGNCFEMVDDTGWVKSFICVPITSRSFS